MKYTELYDKILVIHNAIDNTSEILNRFKDTPVGRGYSKTEIEPFGGGGSETFSLFIVSENGPGLSKIITNGDFTPKPDDQFYEDLKHLDSLMWNLFEDYINFYNLSSKIKTPNTLGYSMRHYIPGSSVGPHSDYIEGNPNKLSITLNIYLNSDFEGGEVEFYAGKTPLDLVDQETPSTVMYKPSTGDVVLFPSNMIHRVRHITSGERYNINALLSEPEKPSWYDPSQGVN